MQNHISHVDISDEMKNSYLDYAMSVIVSRALPDVRDGLKPVHRRILYSMYESGFHYNKQHRKSARVVGDVIGKYHPHGDTVVYDALVRMAQEFSLRMPLIDGQGNFGSVDGDSPAHMRYTECKLSKITAHFLEDIDKQTVLFQSNYDNTESEPTVLPTLLPNLLINGSGGIAVGMATNIPPHNTSEVIDLCCKYIDKPEMEIEEMIEIIKGPDFPTGGQILNIPALHNAYKTGRGIIQVRGVAEVVEEKNSKSSIIISEIPYMVNKSKMIEKIASLVREKKIEGITDLRDESDKDGIRVVIEVRKDAIAEVILKQLYSYTSLQTSFGINTLALDNGVPKLMSLKDIVSAFVNFRKEVVYKRTLYLKNQATNKANVLLGLHIAVSNIDEVIKIIKTSQTPDIAKQRLIEKPWHNAEIEHYTRLLEINPLTESGECFLNEVQAKAILEMRLQRLTNMEKNKILEDLNKLIKDIEYYISILQDSEKLKNLVKEELELLQQKFTVKRKTEILDHQIEQSDLDLIPKEDVAVTVTLDGYIKRVSVSLYKAQHRGGKGRSSIAMNEKDTVTQMFIGTTHDCLLFFSDFGKVYKLEAHKIPIGNHHTKGKHIANLLQLSPNEKIANILILPSEEVEQYEIIFATSNGKIRRNKLTDFVYIPSNGKIAVKLDESDSLIGVSICREDDHILLATQLGKAIRFPVNAVRCFKTRASDGVIAMKLKSSDKVITLTTINEAEFTIDDKEQYLSIPIKDRKGDLARLDIAAKYDVKKMQSMSKAEQILLCITENGYGKCSSSFEYRVTNRGGSGVINFAVSTKTGNVVAALPVTLNEDLLLITNSGKTIRCSIGNLRIMGRNTRGVLLFKTEEGEKVVSAELAITDDEGD